MVRMAEVGGMSFFTQWLQIQRWVNRSSRLRMPEMVNKFSFKVTTLNFFYTTASPLFQVVRSCSAHFFR